MRQLTLLEDHQDNNKQVNVQCVLEKTSLMICFNVTSSQIHTNEQFGKDYRKNWGLWEYDVVETFVQLRSNFSDCKAPYLEWQLSPLGQSFGLMIYEPRKVTVIPLEFETLSNVKFIADGWIAQMTIDLCQLGFNGEQLIYGNLYSILGDTHNRSHYSLFSLDKIDFHQPDFFQKLI